MRITVWQEKKKQTEEGRKPKRINKTVSQRPVQCPITYIINFMVENMYRKVPE